MFILIAYTVHALLLEIHLEYDTWVLQSSHSLETFLTVKTGTSEKMRSGHIGGL